MPARLDRPATKRDLRIYDEDWLFIAPLCATGNITPSEWVRDLVHRAANAKRRELGLPET